MGEERKQREEGREVGREGMGRDCDYDEIDSMSV